MGLFNSPRTQIERLGLNFFYQTCFKIVSHFFTFFVKLDKSSTFHYFFLYLFSIHLNPKTFVPTLTATRFAYVHSHRYALIFVPYQWQKNLEALTGSYFQVVKKHGLLASCSLFCCAWTCHVCPPTLLLGPTWTLVAYSTMRM